MNQDPFPPNNNNNKSNKWSTNKINRMESNNSDDGDYDMDERGNNLGSGGAGGENEMMFCQPVGAAPVGGGSGDQGGNNLPTFEEVDMEDDTTGDDDEIPSHDNGEEGSGISSAEKYADRNSDPGIHVHGEGDYPLPYQQYNNDGLSGHRGGGGGILDGGGPGGAVGNAMAMTNVMDPNIGLPHPNPLPGGSGGVGAGQSPNNSGGPNIGDQSVGTATQTHEVRMPMATPNFKPATGCTNASDFIVRCFVARLRSGITVVKHGRSRWCKSRLRVLHVHPDGRSLSWKPALGEPSSGKRPPKLDLTSCKEVRHAWSPDPDNPMFTGTPILRQKCEAANAHKSFALIFPKRTVDITAVTADQCKVLMEGFSALCFRLQVAQNVANSGGGNTGNAAQATGGASGNNNKGEEDKAATASVTLTNTSLRPDSPKRKKGGKKRSFR